MAPPPGAQAKFREGHVVADGSRIRYWEAGQGEPVVMLGGTAWGLTALHHALARTSHAVAFELPGLGDSPASDRLQSVQALAGTMAQATAMVVPGGHTLIGESFGAHVALWQALLSPDRVDALILISPTAILPAAHWETGSPEPWAALLFAHPENVRGLAQPDPAAFARERELARRLKAEAHDAEVASRLGEVRCPTLAVFGLEDKMVAAEAARVYRERIPNSNIALVYDAGHVIVADRPEALINAVSDFVQRRETFIVGRRTGMINP